MLTSTRYLVITLLLLIVIGCSEEPKPVLEETSTPQPETTVMAETPQSPTPTTPPVAREPQSPTRLNIAYGNLPITLDPHRTSEQFASEILRFICQGLASDDGVVEPVLGAWEYSADNTSMTFILRKDIEFRDGTPLTAEAVVYSLGRLQEPEAEGTPLYETFQNVEIEALDEYTVLFTFDAPRDDFIEDLDSGYAMILSPSSDEATIGTDPICTGAYYVKEWQEGEYILLTKNERHNSAPAYYENQGPAYIDEMKIHLIETHEERFQALLDGILDVNHINTKEELAEVKARPDDFRISEGSWLGGITYLGFNYVRPPLNELEVRQAMAHAIDKNALIDAVLADEFAIPAVSLLSPRTLGYAEDLTDVEYQFDLEAGRQLLGEAGFVDSDGDGLLERDEQTLQLTLLTTTDNIYLDMATVVQAQLAELGIGVDIQQATRSEISEITPIGEFDLLLYDYNWPYPSALNLFLSSERIGSSNRVAYSNPEVDTLLAEIAALGEEPENEALRQEKLIEVQRIIIQDVPWQPVLARRVVSAVNTRVVGEKVRASGIITWQDARIVEK